MATPETLDFESLLAPLPGDSPTGADLRQDFSPTSVYYQIKDARAAARAAERSGAVAGPEQDWPTEWRTVISLGKQILAEHSKDLEVVAWMTEALLREHGYGGLRDGFRLTEELVERYWDQLYPTPDEDGISTRVAPLVGLNGGDSEGTLSVPLALTPLTEESDAGSFSLWRYRKALASGREAAATEGGDTLEMLADAVRRTDAQFLRDTYDDVCAASERFAALCARLDELCGAESPPSSNIKNTLADVRDALVHIGREFAGLALDAPPVDETAADEPEVAGAAAPGAPAAAPSGAITNRADALKVLKKIADFFRETEPHSPMSSLLDKAVRWGQMPLMDLIQELIPDESARRHFGVVTGIEGRGHQSSGDDS